MIKLGDKVKDKITGFSGIAICRSQWLTGCARFTVQPQEMKDGKPVDAQTFDETQLLVVKSGAYEDGHQNDKKGGPRPEVPRR